mmetsp:Transcript_33239/g.34542  ORF Transcript_33239/g.34542 Transcript_33239/m.34542 type:complete len:141 (+) Transcript_33239:18-440(+)
MFLLFLIVNKNGSLIYDLQFTDKINLNANDNIQVAAIFYSMHAISSKLTPNSLEKSHELELSNKGIEVIEADTVKIVCFQTITKLKFIFVIEGNTTENDCELMYKKIYDVYTDLVSKNPFYELEMPIRMSQFDKEVESLF